MFGQAGAAGDSAQTILWLGGVGRFHDPPAGGSGLRGGVLDPGSALVLAGVVVSGRTPDPG